VAIGHLRINQNVSKIKFYYSKAVGKAARVPMNDAKKQEMELAKRLTQETALLKSRINSDVKQSEIMSKEMKNRMV
jgi:hypothetical protein